MCIEVRQNPVVTYAGKSGVTSAFRAIVKRYSQGADRSLTDGDGITRGYCAHKDPESRL